MPYGAAQDDNDHVYRAQFYNTNGPEFSAVFDLQMIKSNLSDADADELFQHVLDLLNSSTEIGGDLGSGPIVGSKAWTRRSSIPPSA